MVHLIESSTLNDLDHIFSLYDEAMRFQQAKKTVVVWPKFATSLVLQEINEERQWKLLIDGEIACVWAIAYSDPQIWEEKDRDPAIYIHRIATSSKFRGLELVKKIVDWAKEYAIKKEKKYVRLDTLGENIRLITYYQQMGFTFLGMFPLRNTEGLPAHYHTAPVCLFEIKL